ncbi:MAG TPA: hypothetical protein VFH73_11945 [Polyangia bacterium]|nr:hypothetical protein [Polyangia bacterium]
MKLSWIFVGLVVLAGVTASGVAAVGCGPQNKFCPNTPTGMCPPPYVPPDDAGAEDVHDTGVDRGRDRRN